MIKLNLKKTKLASGLLATLMSLCALDAFALNKNLQFYGGVAAGYSAMKAKLNSKIDFSDTAPGGAGVFPNQTEFFGKKTKSDSFVGELLVGTRYFIDRMYLGLELSAFLDAHSSKHDFIFALNNGVGDYYDFRTRLSRRYGFIPAVVFGWKFCEKWALFAKFGFALSKFKLEIERRDINTVFTKSKNLYGFSPVVGLEYDVAKNIALTAAVGGEFYQPIKNSNGPDIDLLFNAGAPTLSGGLAKTSPRVYSIKFGIIIKS